jgi:malonyl-CoA O-methyltransferase
MLDMSRLSSQSILPPRKRQIASAFGRAAKHYDKHAAFQREVGYQLLSEMPDALAGAEILDLGGGTGFFTQILRQRGATVVYADLSEQMMSLARQRCGDLGIDYCLCDAESLPFENNSFDFVFSNLALQWCDNLSQPLQEISRILKKGGQGYFSTLIEGSLIELEMAWRQVDSLSHVNQFLSLNDIKLVLTQARSATYRIKSKPIQLWYDSALSLMKDLKGIGATHIDGRSQGMSGRRALLQVESAYQKVSNREGLLPATYQVCFGVLYQ